MKKKLTFLVTILIFFLTSLTAQEKKIITSASDVPQHSYKLPAENASEIVDNSVLLNQLMAMIKADIIADMQQYDFRNNATLRDYYRNLRIVAFIEKDYKAVMEYMAKERELSDKEPEKILRGREMEILVNLISKDNSGNLSLLHDAIKSGLIKMLEPYDFKLIQENIQSLRGNTEILSENLLRGVISGQLQPVIENNKETVPLEVAMSLVSMFYNLNYYLPAKEAYREAYDYLLITYGSTVEKTDIWKDRDANLAEIEKLSPVIIGIWDTGIDMGIFSETSRWINSSEKKDKLDNDGNNFIDDIYGIGYDMKGALSMDLLEPDAVKMENIREYQQYIKGLEDLNATIASTEASDLKRKLSEMKPQDMNDFLEKLGLYGLYAHGTHVAGIALQGNPAGRVLCARLSFDYHSIPFVPDEATANQWAAMFKNVIAYFKMQGVKVVNMSWSVGLETEFISPMKSNGVGANDEERLAIAKKLFTIERNAFIEAAESAPEVLFICAAGNDNDDVDFTGEFPASLNLPNILTVGAVDIEGRKTSFTTEGASVDVYANGYEVESYVPGGDKIKFSGTSMASPQVVNLAAKLWSVKPGLSVEQAKDIILKTATPSEEGSKIMLINPAKAIEMARSL